MHIHVYNNILNISQGVAHTPQDIEYTSQHFRIKQFYTPYNNLLFSVSLDASWCILSKPERNTETSGCAEFADL